VITKIIQKVGNITYLEETDVVGVLPEALAAHVEPVFTDQTVSVRANPAGKKEIELIRLSCT